jgi:hypothetical protein
MREFNDILNMIGLDGYLVPKISRTTSSVAYYGECIDYYYKDEITVAEMIDLLDTMDFRLLVKEINEDEEYILLQVFDLQDITSSMNGLELYVNIKDEETTRQEMYEILIGNFENHLNDYGYEFI